MDAVNLLPLEYRERKRKRATPADNLDGRKTLRIGGGVALLFAVLLGALFFHEHQVINSNKKALADNKAKIAAVQPQVDAVRSAQAAVSGRLSLAKSLTANRMNWDRALNDFARILPTNSFLSSIQMTAPYTAASQAAPTVAPVTSTDGSADSSSAPVAPVAPSGVSTLTLSGTAPSTPGVALVMDRLALIPWLSNVLLTSAARTQDTGANTFSMSATVSEAH
jgi:Tfp pilus assembly protein PilN